MDSAKTSPDQGTFWLPEERAWLFYWDRIETHALALRALSEIEPQDPRRHGLVTWLMLNKKLNQWSSTRATAEVDLQPGQLPRSRKASSASSRRRWWNSPAGRKRSSSSPTAPKPAAR